MPLVVSLVHHPASVSREQWRRLRASAPGPHPHEVRLAVVGGHQAPGAEIRTALRDWVAQVLGGPPHRVPAMYVAGSDLSHIASGSAQIHPGMVVTLMPDEPADGPVARADFGLRLCVDQGPDAGQVYALGRGSSDVGRAADQVRIADPRLGRRHLTIEVGTRSVRLRRSPEGSRRRRPRTDTWSAESPLVIGDSTLTLLNTVSPAPTSRRWPPPSEVVTEKPPEGRHRMMLIMALVPMVIGIVLVTVTGMWFFLLFSAVSALVAGATVIDARRRRRRFRAAVSQAAHRWAESVDSACPTPGRLAATIGEAAGRPNRLAAGALGLVEDRPPFRVLRCGRAALTPELSMPSGIDMPERTRVDAVLALETPAAQATEIAGPARGLHRTARWLVVQMLIRPAPERGTVLLAGRARSVLSDLAPDLPDLIRSYDAADIREFLDTPVTPILVCRSEDLRDREGDPTALARRAEDLLRQGWHVMVLRPEGAGGHPITCRIRLDLTAHMREETDTVGRGFTSAENVLVDGVSDGTAARMLRRALPSSTSLTGATHIPDHVTEQLPEQLMVRSAAQDLATVLGVSRNGPLSLDLVTDGPHILVAGTSGSGKSEFLKALMLSWAGRYGPDELNFMLFDFKGGAAFRRIADIEHSLGLVTDLSKAQAERTLEAVRSELTRREELFLEADAADYPEFRRRRPLEPLPRILVVIDEFRIFSHELPDTMDELMRLATLGRSLGLHLILSTQRPQGVVTADIRANIGAVVALRLRSSDESQDLVGTPAAADISRRSPGRGIIARPGEPPQEFQSALIVPRTSGLRAHPAQEVGREMPREHDHENADAVAAVVGQEMSVRSLRRSHSPVLEPLPGWLHVRGDDRAAGAVVGRIDRPSHQAQDALVFDPEESTSLGLIGEAASGGREALRMLALQLLDGPHRVHLYLLDADGALEGLQNHARVGAALTDEHRPEFDHLLLRLKDELTRRRTRPGPHTPIVVLMSGHSQWHALNQSFGATGMDHVMGTLIAEGAQVDITVVISGGRELASGKLGARFSRRVYLPYGVSQDSRFLWPKLREVDPVPGRGVHISPETPSAGHEVQLAGACDVDRPRSPSPDEPRPEVVVRPLPEDLALSQLAHRPGEDEAVLGVRQFSLAPVTLTPAGVTLVSGAPGTGRTNALRVIEAQIPKTLWVGPQTSVPTHLDEAPSLVLVDDADRCTPAHHRLVEQCLDAGAAVVATAAPTPALWSRIPWSHHARTAGEHLLLSPTQRSQSDVFATPVPLLDRPVPGRAVHLRSTGPEMIQWLRHGDS